MEFGDRVDLFSAWYGETYTRMFLDVCLPNLISTLPPGKQYRHLIYTTPAEAAKLTGLPFPACVDTTLLDGPEPRKRLYRCVYNAINISWLSRSYVVMAQPDHVFGWGIAGILEAMRPYDYVVCGHPRIVRAPPVGLSNRQLVAFAMHTAPHSIVTYGLANPLCPYWRAERKPYGYSVTMKEPPPIAFHGTPDMLEILTGKVTFGRFEVLDHEMTDHKARYGMLRTIDDSDVFFWAELTDPDKYVPTIENDYWSDTARRLAYRELRWRT